MEYSSAVNMEHLSFSLAISEKLDDQTPHPVAPATRYDKPSVKICICEWYVFFATVKDKIISELTQECTFIN